MHILTAASGLLACAGVASTAPQRGHNTDSIATEDAFPLLQYNTANGPKFHIRCHQRPESPCVPPSKPGFKGCIDQCAAKPHCTEVSYKPHDDSCHHKPAASLMMRGWNDHSIWEAKIVDAPEAANATLGKPVIIVKPENITEVLAELADNIMEQAKQKDEGERILKEIIRITGERQKKTGHKIDTTPAVNMLETSSSSFQKRRARIIDGVEVETQPLKEVAQEVFERGIQELKEEIEDREWQEFVTQARRRANLAARKGEHYDADSAIWEFSEQLYLRSYIHEHEGGVLEEDEDSSFQLSADESSGNHNEHLSKRSDHGSSTSDGAFGATSSSDEDGADVSGEEEIPIHALAPADSPPQSLLSSALPSPDSANLVAKSVFTPTIESPTYQFIVYLTPSSWTTSTSSDTTVYVKTVFTTLTITPPTSTTSRNLDTYIPLNRIAETYDVDDSATFSSTSPTFTPSLSTTSSSTSSSSASSFFVEVVVQSSTSTSSSSLPTSPSSSTSSYSPTAILTPPYQPPWIPGLSPPQYHPPLPPPQKRHQECGSGWNQKPCQPHEYHTDDNYPIDYQYVTQVYWITQTYVQTFRTVETYIETDTFYPSPTVCPPKSSATCTRANKPCIAKPSSSCTHNDPPIYVTTTVTQPVVSTSKITYLVPWTETITPSVTDKASTVRNPLS
ncbi:hypothetical protein K491DRAFT_340096 [Lophiostoma macrostomum CBS 122681]|uniref:Apple domain-containing protein n=1 Tax=Lophiostoma macrostomum CBS 122681 TaxID=1314788 RepID=A0A6A6TT05_9PLEO|nr:hypothetical protein K491DRAFT_340096 [Lophiostoma macrostomum CBS 122681]